MSQGVIKFKLKILNWSTLNLLHFFYNDDYSIDVHIDESNFSYI